MRRLIIIPVLIVIAVVLVFLISQRQKANTLPENVIYSSGTVESNAVTASAQIMGKVIEKRHKKGDMVTKGDTLALIERDMLESKQRELSASEASTESDLAAARIDLENSKKNLTRMQEAYKAGSVPQKDLDNLNAAYQSGDKRVQSLQARIEMLQSQMQSLQIQIGYTTIVAPVSGFIQSDPIEVGEIAAIGTTLFEVVDLSDTWVEIYISESDIPYVHLNDTAEVFLDATPKNPAKGVVSFVSQKAEFTPKNIQTKKERIKQVFAVRVRVDNSTERFKPGLPVDVYLKKR